MKQTLSAINDAERDWLDSNIAATSSLVAELAGAGAELTPASLDTAFAAWLDSHNPDQQDPNPIINAFGSAFGQYLADTLGLNWVVTSDEHGTEMAVHGQPGDILIFPPNLVAKRYVNRETGFFTPVYDALHEQVNTIRSQPAAKPWWKIW